MIISFHSGKHLDYYCVQFSNKTQSDNLKFAAVDIGSNAIRFQITSILKHNGIFNFKKLEYVRFPLRLGQDVFQYNKISPEKEEKFLKLMKTFKMLLELYEVDDYIFCATSAMRESANGRAIAERVKEEVGIIIDIIDGDTEAELINAVLFNELDEKSYIHIDVGGGSTELNFFVNKQKVAAQSFKIGSVRRLNKLDAPEEWDRMKEWVQANISKAKAPIYAIGTGGNIGKIYELAHLSRSKDLKPSIKIEKIEGVQKQVASMSYDDRIHVLNLNPDRADVIVPASDIYISVMQYAGAKEMLVPELGLKDGLIQMLFKKHMQNQEQLTIINTNKFPK
jgi:exopolyphosphatase/guanosine-5'-triphosphate,3'-diphosphate pyrophosphatase